MPSQIVTADQVPESIRSQIVTADQVPEFLRAPSAVDRQSAENALTTFTGSRAKSGRTALARKKIARKKLSLAHLQDKYGDDSTVTYSSGKASYDEDELSKRALVDELGFKPKPITGWKAPLIHFGKEASDVLTGIKTSPLNPFSTSEEKQDLYNQYASANKIYAAGDHSLPGRIGGALLPVAATMGTSIPSRALIGAGVKKFSPDVGEAILRRASMQGARMPTKLLPGTVGATEGALYGGVQPVDPSMDIGDQLGQIVRNAALGGAVGAAGEGIIRGVGRAAQRGVTGLLESRARGNLPKPLNVPTPLLYGDAETYNKIAQVAGRAYTKPSKDTAKSVATGITNKFKLGLQNNLQAMNKNMTGSDNLEIGKSIAPVMKRYKAAYEASQKAMNDAYDAVSGGKLRYINADLTAYENFINKLDRELAGMGYSKTKASRSGFNELKRLVDADKKNMEFNGMELISRYKALNDVYANAKPKQKAAINYMRGKLVEFMDNPHNFSGDAGALKRFKDATSIAAKHYDTFTGVKAIDQYLAGDITASDISSKVFSGATLDISEGPKAQIVNKILRVDNSAKPALRNEVFAHLSHEFDQGQAFPEAISKIKRKILSGSDEGIHGQLFEPDQLKQFETIVHADDILKMQAFPYSEGKLNAMQDITDRGSLNPLRAMQYKRIPGRSEEDILNAVTSRAGRGLIAPTQPTTMLFPFLTEPQREEKRREALSLPNIWSEDVSLPSIWDLMSE